MRLLILIDCYLPTMNSTAKLIHDLALEFGNLGHEVTILTPSHAIADAIQVRDEEGLRIARVRMGKIKGVPKIVRAIQEVRLSNVIWRRAQRFLRANPADAIIYYSPTIFFGALVRRLKSLWGCPSYLILRDIFPQWAVDSGILKKGIAWRFFRQKERAQYDAADVIAVQSRGDLRYFNEHFSGKNYRPTVLYNWARSREVGLPPTSYRNRLGLQDKVVFVYGGNLGVAQDVDNLIRLAASLIDRPEIHFLFVGEGTEMPRMERLIAARQLQNIHLLPAVGQHEYHAMLSECDVGLLSLDRRLTTHNVPGKLFGYMYWGKPVLASLNPGNDLFNLLGHKRAGFCLVNGDDANLTAAALQLASDVELRTQMGRNARSLLETTFSSRAAAEQILEELSVASGNQEQPEALLACRS
jgi:O26/O145-antigen biosynthesis N-acetyl-L-fucosamine transferase